MIAFADDASEHLLQEISIPLLLLFMSCAIQVGYTAVIQAAFQDERILPFGQKATAINIIVLVSKTLTIGAPFVNELEEPIPIYFIIGLSVLTIILGFFLKSKEQLDEMQKVKIPVGSQAGSQKKEEYAPELLFDKEKAPQADPEDGNAEASSDDEDEEDAALARDRQQ